MGIDRHLRGLLAANHRRGCRLALAALLVAAAAAGCGGREGGDAGAESGEERAAAALDGGGMEPRIVTEHPVDAPGRPADGERAPAVALAEPAAAWVPHLAASDLAASVDFYRDLGFEVASQLGGERVELARDGARLVLVAAAGEDDDGGAGAPGEGAAGDDAPPAPSPPLILHLVDEAGGEGGRSVRDPDGHRVAIPGGG